MSRVGQSVAEDSNQAVGRGERRGGAMGARAEFGLALRLAWVDALDFAHQLPSGPTIVMLATEPLCAMDSPTPLTVALPSKCNGSEDGRQEIFELAELKTAEKEDREACVFMGGWG